MLKNLAQATPNCQEFLLIILAGSTHALMQAGDPNLKANIIDGE